MKGKSALLAGVAAIALVATAQAGYAAKKTSDATSAPAPAPVAAPAGPSNAELATRIQALEDALQADESKAQGDHTRLSTLEQNFQYASWTFDNGRPVISSGDGRFSMAFRVRFQADMANFMQDSVTDLKNSAPQSNMDLSTGAVFRRAFFGVEGKAFKDFWYEIRYNGGGTNGEATALSLARVAYLGIPNVMINVGMIEPAMMFEGTTSSGQLMFMERPQIDNIAADTFGGADGRRGIEVRYQKDSIFMPGDNLVLNLAYTGAASGSTTAHGPGGDEQTQLNDRVSYRFWSDGASNASVGFTSAWVLNSATKSLSFGDRPQIRVDGTKLVNASVAANTAAMYAFDGGINIDNFFVGGEWAEFQVDRLNSGTLAGDTPVFHGWYLEGSWILTGETKSYTVSSTNNEVGGFGAPKVANPFSLSGDSWGAFELTFRYTNTNLNWNATTAATATNQAGINGGKERDILFGLNWYLNNNVKLQVNDIITNIDKFSGVAHSTATNAGQDFNTVGIRLQFSN